MDVTQLDPVALRKSMRLALDVVTAHRIARGLPLDVEHATRIRETLEERVLGALAATSDSRMPSNWSWERAAEAVAMLAALSIVEAQKAEDGASGV